MHLITMAHAGEAQGVIEKFKLSRISPDLYKSESIILLLTGEGPFEAATKTALVIPQYPITHVVNIGIAGSLTDKYPVGSFLEVRTLYLIHGQTPAYKSFQAGDKGVDCLTSFERILDPRKAEVLKGLGHLVDREAWGVAMAAKTARIPFQCFKIISDRAGSLDACELVKDKALDYSISLVQKLEEFLKVKSVSEEEILPDGFHFTFSTRHQFKSLLNKLSIKEETSPEDILKALPLDELRQLDILPKEKTKILLQKMDDKVDPIKAILVKTSKELGKKFSEQGIQIHIDHEWERTSLRLSLEVQNNQELLEKAEALKKLSIEPFTKLMKGEFDVE